MTKSMRIAINGFGRIGRNILRALYDPANAKRFAGCQLVAINDLANAEANAHLLQYDSTHGRFSADIKVEDSDTLVINNDKIKICAVANPEQLPWRELDIDLVLECTGRFTSKAKANAHLIAGAKRVLISAPAGNDVDATIVYGVNETSLTADMTIVSNASCTTNCLAPLVLPLHRALGLESGLMTTIHAYTNDQVLADVYHSDLRRARAAGHSMIPTSTGAAAAVGLVIPELAGKLDGFAMRVPVLNVSVVDLTFIAKTTTTVTEVNQILEQAVLADRTGVIAANTLPLVSVDFNHNSASSIFDLTQTKVIGNLVKVLAWYDNEWGFANRMLDVAWLMNF